VSSQLPPTVKSATAAAGGLNISLFERLLACGLRAPRLTTQYRMHPAIAQFPSSKFYEGSLLDAPSVIDSLST